MWRNDLPPARTPSTGGARCWRCPDRCWVSVQTDRLGVPVVPIPGTKRVKWLEQNVAALDVTLTADDLAVLDPLADHVVGSRY
jgi:hypothetical protein